LVSVISFPLNFKDKIIGVLQIGFREEEQKTNIHLIQSLEKLIPHLASEISRKQLEQELNQIFQFAPDIICVIGVDRYFKKMNPAGLQ
ncbi:hypothetical protein ABTM76_19695, partial [Acinetobacter baumannii]